MPQCKGESFTQGRSGGHWGQKGRASGRKRAAKSKSVEMWGADVGLSLLLLHRQHLARTARGRVLPAGAAGPARPSESPTSSPTQLPLASYPDPCLAGEVQGRLTADRQMGQECSPRRPKRFRTRPLHPSPLGIPRELQSRSELGAGRQWLLLCEQAACTVAQTTVKTVPRVRVE